MRRRSIALLVLAPLAPVFGTAQDESDRDRSWPFHIPETRGARDRAERFEEHVDARRWSEALRELQDLIELHRGDVLPPEWRAPDAPRSTTSNWPGAADWAARQLRELPPEARTLYRERHASASAAALAAARKGGDRRALAEVAQRWPISDAAEQAWWTLGDLELELGNAGAATRAWERAAGLRELAGGEPSPGETARRELTARIETGGADLEVFHLGEPGTSELRLAGPDEGSGPVPFEPDEPWSRRIPPGPIDGNEFGLFPVVQGDRVIVNTSLRMLAVDAHSNAELWRTPEPMGWAALEPTSRHGFFDGIDDGNQLIAAAASDGVAVGALQIPHRGIRNTDYQGIDITRQIPTRRLFAYDIETGEPLWDHQPPHPWDGESGTFGQRMSVAGPPVISGSRVLVPCYRLEGRIDFRVACYDLATGRLLWSTPLVSGQRPLNMFGRHVNEFSAPPVRVEGDRVVVLTQLGIVASLDLFTGRTLWESMYEPVPLPKSRGWEMRQRRQVWRNAPPVVASGVIVVAPNDADHLAGFDLESGAALWTWPYRELRDNVNVLLGADEDRIYLGGRSIVALHKQGGLANPGPFLPAWRDSYDHPDGSYGAGGPRALLTRDAILVPARAELVVLDRATGLARNAPVTTWQHGHHGNLLLADGALFSLSGAQLHGFFDWSVLLTRARGRLDADPADRAARLSLTSLLVRRGRALHADGDSERGLEDLAEAYALLEGSLSRPDAGLDRQLAETGHTVLRALAAALSDLGSSEEAFDRLAQALPLSTTPEERRDTLLAMEALRRAGPLELWLEVVQELELSCAALPLPEDGVGFSTGAVDLAPSQRAAVDVLVGQWVLVERAHRLAQRGRVADELADLHAAIASYGDRPLATGLTVHQWARDRIGARLESGARRAYAPYERTAQDLLDAALANGDDDALARVVWLYPHSAAARSAGDARLALAFEQGDLKLAARLVYGARPSSGARLDEHEARALVRLAALLGAGGNRELRRAVYERVLREHPSLLVEVEGERRTVAELHGELPALTEPGVPADRARFDATLGLVANARGQFAIVGDVPRRTVLGEAGAATPVLVTHSDKVVAYGPDDRPGAEGQLREQWSFAFPMRVTPAFWRDTTWLSPGRAVVGSLDRVIGIDTERGERAWVRELDDAALTELTGAHGVALARMPGDDNGTRVRAFDAWQGHDLWQIDLDVPADGLTTVCGDGVAVFLSRQYASTLRAVAVDLVRGVEIGRFDLGADFQRSSERSAWIEDGLLVVPSFLSIRVPDRNHIVGFELRTFERSWSVELEAREELYSVARTGGETYLYLRPAAEDDLASGGSITQLVVATGATRLVKSLKLGEEPIGLDRSTVVELPGPYLFLLSGDVGGPTTPVTAVRLPYGKHWVFALPVSYEELFRSRMPLPALSDSTVAIAYTTMDRVNSLQRDTHLVLLDRATGRRLDSRLLVPEMGVAEDITLFGRGESLFLLGQNHGPSGQLEIWRRDTDR